MNGKPDKEPNLSIVEVAKSGISVNPDIAKQHGIDVDDDDLDTDEAGPQPTLTLPITNNEQEPASAPPDDDKSEPTVTKQDSAGVSPASSDNLGDQMLKMATTTPPANPDANSPVVSKSDPATQSLVDSIKAEHGFTDGSEVSQNAEQPRTVEITPAQEIAKKHYLGPLVKPRLQLQLQQNQINTLRRRPTRFKHRHHLPHVILQVLKTSLKIPLAIKLTQLSSVIRNPLKLLLRQTIKQHQKAIQPNSLLFRRRMRLLALTRTIVGTLKLLNTIRRDKIRYSFIQPFHQKYSCYHRKVRSTYTFLMKKVGQSHSSREISCGYSVLKTRGHGRRQPTSLYSMAKTPTR